MARSEAQPKVGASVCFTERECKALGWDFYAIAQEARRRTLSEVRGPLPAWVSARHDGRFGVQVWLGDQARGAQP